MEDLVISENIEVIVYGPCSDRFIEAVLLNRGFPSAPLISPLIKQNKDFLSLFLQESGAMTPNPTNTAVGTVQSPQQQQQNISKNKNRRRNYFKNVNKLLGLGMGEEEGEKTGENLQVQQLEKGVTFLSWADFRRATSTISTKNFWINVNFNVVSDMFLDPYINNFVTASINLLVLAFELDSEPQLRKALDLYKKLATAKPPSSIKYQSQMLLLQSGYYQAFNDNIVLALCELPEIEPIGPCCLVGFGEKDQDLKGMGFEEEKTLSKYLNLERDGVNGCLGFYEWLVQTHQQVKYAGKLDEEHMAEILQAVRSDLTRKNNGGKGCGLF